MMFERPHFMDMYRSVTHLQGFIDFSRAPRPRQCPFLVRVRALDTFTVQGNVDTLFSTGPTQTEKQFTTEPVRQDGMME